MPHRLATLCLASLCLTAAMAGCQSTNPIPTLDPQGDVYKTEGPNDNRIYGTTVGKKKAIMVFVDFSDKPMNIDTRERGEQALGGDTFETLFAQQSYGRMTVSVDQVHGWRRLPKPSRDYDTSKTLTHRDMFVEIFELYPEVNFLDYDYIISNMPGVGNTAFGAHGQEAIAYNGEKITVALNLASQTPYVLAHEVGHLMGLPDLYTYGDLQPKNPAGPWDIMSQARNATGFIGWHRHKFGWLDNDRKTYLVKDTHTLTLTPIDGDEGVSMIAVPAVNEDPENPSKVYVIEAAQPLRVKQEHKPGGVIVYSVDAKLATGQNPVVVHFGEGKDKINAAYHEGETFNQDDAPMSVKVLKKNDDGSFAVQIIVK
jgi:M6 family metalloprotease-like protein